MEVLYNLKINYLGSCWCLQLRWVPKPCNVSTADVSRHRTPTSGHFDGCLKYPFFCESEELACSAVCVEPFIFVNDLLNINFPTQKATSLVSLMARTSGIIQNPVGETLLVNGPPFVYLLWKIHFLTCDNISLSPFSLLPLFTSFFTLLHF